MLAGLIAMASAMGIGRFAFTPMLPLMQQASALTLQEGAWLASANYAGYLAGALALTALDPAPSPVARAGLAAVALSTLAMGLTDAFAPALVLRFLAGIASACVLVGVSGRILPVLTSHGRASWAGVVFAGVGVGIAFAGLIGLAAGVFRFAPSSAWLWFGALATAAAVIAWPAFQHSVLPSTVTPHALPRRGALTGHWRLVLCYAAFGFGYILPATFLPALARQMIDDAAVFGWAWPVFGMTASASAIVASRWIPKVPVLVWAIAQLVMAIGVLAPVVFAGIGAIIVCAICVGGTFVVVTLAAIEHARIVSGAAAPRVVAAMTAAFAFGQLVGPLTLRGGDAGAAALLWPTSLAATVLAVSACALFAEHRALRAGRAARGGEAD